VVDLSFTQRFQLAAIKPSKKQVLISGSQDMVDASATVIPG
jgi:hypothetical protein